MKKILLFVLQHNKVFIECVLTYNPNCNVIYLEVFYYI